MMNMNVTNIYYFRKFFCLVNSCIYHVRKVVMERYLQFLVKPINLFCENMGKHVWLNSTAYTNVFKLEINVIQ